MTTIAITKTEIAADGLRTWGGELRGFDFQKIYAANHAIFSFTGNSAAMQALIDWQLSGADVKTLPDKVGDDWTLVIIDHQGVGKYTSSCPYRENFEPPIAFGAGADYAIGAMWHGASAFEAVRLVADNCNHTGGKIQVVNYVEHLERAQQIANQEAMPEAAE